MMQWMNLSPSFALNSKRDPPQGGSASLSHESGVEQPAKLHTADSSFRIIEIAQLRWQLIQGRDS